MLERLSDSSYAICQDIWSQLLPRKLVISLSAWATPGKIYRYYALGHDLYLEVPKYHDQWKIYTFPAPVVAVRRRADDGKYFRILLEDCQVLDFSYNWELGKMKTQPVSEQVAQYELGEGLRL